MNINTTLAELAAVRAALATEAELQPLIEAKKYDLTVTVKATSNHPLRRGQTIENRSLNSALSKMLVADFRNLLDVAGDSLRTQERELSERLIVEAAHTAMGKV